MFYKKIQIVNWKMGTKRAEKYLITLSAAAAVDYFMHSNFWIKINNYKWDKSYDNLIFQKLFY